MRSSTFPAMLLLRFLATTSACGANEIGVAYIAEADVLVYGGSDYSYRSQNPDDVRTLYVEQRDGGARRVLYRGEGVLSNIQAAPQGAYVGILERTWEENVSQERATYVDRRVDEDGRVVESYYREESALLVLDLDGSVEDEIRDVRRYAWSPDGDSLVFLTGSYEEGGLGFAATGTSIYDISSREARSIRSGGWDVEWASWNGSVYVYDPFNEENPDTNVFRFDLATEQAATTTHQGIHFSADGDYYYRQGYEGAPLAIFRTETDTEISADLSVDSAEHTRTLSFARGWLDGGALVIASPHPHDRGDYLYEVNTGSLLRAAGPVMEGPGDRILVLEGTVVLERSLYELAIVR